MDAQRPYEHLRVVEFANNAAGELVGKLFAQMGADVIKIEPPEGSPSRHIGPYVRDQEDPEHSLTYWHYNVSKKSVVLDVVSESGRDCLVTLLQDADIFVFSGHLAEFRELELSSELLAVLNPRLVSVVITPFGLTGPWSEMKSCDLVSFAASGVLANCGYDDHSIPPIRPTGNQTFHTAASFAHSAALLALIGRLKSNRGDFIDLAVHDSMAITVELANAYWFYPGVKIGRQTARLASPTPTAPAQFVCADGRHVVLVFILNEQKAWTIMLEWLDSHGLSMDLVDDAYLDPTFRQKNFAHIQEVLEVFFLMIDAETAFREGQSRGMPIGAVYSPEEVLDIEHLRIREFFSEVDFAGAAGTRTPGAPYRFSAFDERPPARSPRLGEHTSRVLLATTSVNR
ncbi:CaiB/BaiF CoA-transferase family protein [Nocardia sp. 348MFTsu5.1]|uniref:CaiB/BaiF CoA transferase family protein n=1 Tax=Nocardia sp. 348MFTsu5.1 TaxID=1172185 RepID=UPI0003678C98|nr:CoA transferase [Nocardia sp. 348MFTsu5.1]